MDTIPALAEGLESLRQKLLVYRYQFLHFRHCRIEVDDELNQVKPDIRRFEELVAEIKEKIRERKQLTAEKNTVPIWNLVRKHELSQQLAQVMEELDRQIDLVLPRSLVLDLEGLTFTDSSGIAVLIRAFRRMKQLGGNLTVCGTPEQARKVFYAAGLQKLMRFE